MTVKSAKAGSITFDTLMADVINITFVDAANVKEFASSSTNGEISRFEGHSDRTGSFTMKADVAPAKGDIGTLTVKSDAAVTLWSGTAIILDRSFTVPVEEGEAIEVVVTWGQKPV